MIRLATLCGLFGLALATVLFVGRDLGLLFGTLLAAGWGLVWVSLFHFVSMAFNARAWQVLFPGRRRPSLAFTTWLIWTRESVNGLLPVARVGGEVVCARLLMRWGMRGAPAVGSLVVDMSLSLGTQFAFTVLGIALLAARTDDQGLVTQLALGTLAMLPLVGVVFAVQRYGAIELLGRVFRAMFRDRFADVVGGARRLDRRVRNLYLRRRAVLACCGWQLLSWIVGAGEIWLALYFLGHPVSVWDAILIEALVQAVASTAFVIPGAIGVQEGGFLLVGALLGIGPEVSLALALSRRVRDVLVFAPALIAWQVLEGRWLWRARAKATG
jgi:glycosyltransferase 2 family protein